MIVSGLLTDHSLWHFDFLFKHQHLLIVSPGAMILPNNHVLKELKKGKGGGKQVSHRKEPAECSLQYQRK